MSQSIRRALYRAKGLPDPGPTPSVDSTQLTILVPRTVAKAIDDLADFLVKQYPHRNDLLEDLLKEGLRIAMQARVEAEDALALKQQAAQQADIAMGQGPVIEAETRGEIVVSNPGLSPEENAQMSARLRALRGA